jgi:hypothetical protein
LVNLVFHYRDLHAAGRWHFRAYVRAGDMLSGRWRETFTKENVRGASCALLCLICLLRCLTSLLRPLSSGYEGPFVMYRVDGPAYRQRQQEHAALPFQRTATATPRQLLAAPALSTGLSPPALSVPKLQAPQPALGSHDMGPPATHEQLGPRYRSLPGYAHHGQAPAMPLARAYRRGASPPRNLRYPAQEQFGDRPAPSTPPTVIPPINPSGTDDRHGGIRDDERPSPVHDPTAVPDIWSRSLASGGVKRSADEMQERRKSEGEESRFRRPWENEERGEDNKNENKTMARVSDSNNRVACSRTTRCLLTSRGQQVPSVKGQPVFSPLSDR